MSIAKLFAAGAVTLTLFGCASATGDFATSGSPSHYDGFDCRQLADEATRLSRRAKGVSGAELDRMKDEFGAIERASVQKNCGHEFKRR